MRGMLNELVLCSMEVVCTSECSLREVPLYTHVSNASQCIVSVSYQRKLCCHIYIAVVVVNQMQETILYAPY